MHSVLSGRRVCREAVVNQSPEINIVVDAYRLDAERGGAFPRSPLKPPLPISATSKISAARPNICIIDRIGAHETMESLKRKHVVFDEDNATPGPSEPAGAGVHPDRAAAVAAAEGAAVKKPKVRELSYYTFDGIADNARSSPTRRSVTLRKRRGNSGNSRRRRRLLRRRTGSGPESRARSWTAMTTATAVATTARAKSPSRQPQHLRRIQRLLPLLRLRRLPRRRMASPRAR